MSQPALLTLSRMASVVGGLLWACLAPVFVYADRALDRPEKLDSRWRSAVCGWSALCRSCFCCLASLNFGH
jgi:hypothetical protein